MKSLLIKIIKLYKKYISPRLNTGCIFTPTCSIYAIEALEKRGLFMGIILTVWRILRCNSLNKGGFDPVPDSNKVKKWLL